MQQSFIKRLTVYFIFCSHLVIEIYCSLNSKTNGISSITLEKNNFEMEIYKMNCNKLIETLIYQKNIQNIKSCSEILKFFDKCINDSAFESFELFESNYKEYINSSSFCPMLSQVKDVDNEPAQHVEFFHIYLFFSYYLNFRSIIYSPDIAFTYTDYDRKRNEFIEPFKAECLFTAVSFEILYNFEDRKTQDFTIRILEIFENPDFFFNEGNNSHLESVSHSIESAYYKSKIDLSYIYIDQVSMFEKAYQDLKIQDHREIDCDITLEYLKQISAKMVFDCLYNYIDLISESPIIYCPVFIMFSLGEFMRLLQETEFWSHFFGKEPIVFYSKFDKTKNKITDDTDIKYIEEFLPTESFIKYQKIIEIYVGFVRFWRSINQRSKDINDLKNKLHKVFSSEKNL